MIGLTLGLAFQRLGGGLPIYDGIGLPVVYRYCNPPADLKSSNQPPLPGHTSLGLQKGQVMGGTVQTDDQIVAAYFGTGSIGVSPGATSVTVTIAPVCKDSFSPPSAGIAKGNVYGISAVEQPSGQPAVAVHPLRVVLSYPPGPFTDIEFHDSLGWHHLPTINVSSQSAAQADLLSFGQFAAVGPSGRESLLTTAVHLVESFGLLAFVLIFGAIAVVQELRRRRRKTQFSELAWPPRRPPRRDIVMAVMATVFQMKVLIETHA